MNLETDIIISLISRIREKANRFITTELSAHGLIGLKPIHGDLLLALFQYDRPTMKALAEIVDRKKSTVTTLVNKLVQLGYVQKAQDETDFRMFRISLTRKGRALKPHLLEISHALIAKVYNNIPEKEQRNIVKSLTKINATW